MYGGDASRAFGRLHSWFWLTGTYASLALLLGEDAGTADNGGEAAAGGSL